MLHSTWPNLFKDLREKGIDYVERQGRRGLTASTVRVHIPLALGIFEWQVNHNWVGGRSWSPRHCF